MIAHLVLMKPKADLSDDDRRAFIDAFEHAIREIPQVTGVRIGRRIRIGAGYEPSAPDDADYLAVIEFADRAGLSAYLQHPAHAEVGSRFHALLNSALVYDYEVGGLEKLREW